MRLCATLSLLLPAFLGLIKHDHLAQGAQPTEVAIDDVHEPSPSDMGHTRLTFLQFVTDALDEVLLCIAAILQERPLQRVTFRVSLEHLQSLVNRYVEQVFQSAPNHPYRHFGAEVGINKMPQVFHVLLYLVVGAVHEAEQEHFRGLMQTVMISELFILEQTFRI